MSTRNCYFCQQPSEGIMCEPCTAVCEPYGFILGKGRLAVLIQAGRVVVGEDGQFLPGPAALGRD